MQKFKKIVAIALTATMVLGCTVTAFADVVTEGSSAGSGTSEGHLEKKATDVVLPTIASGSTPFAYTMDPERLISETEHQRLGTSVEFPSSGDTGVYWNNGPKGTGADADITVYANSSPAQKVTNKSSHAINLTVSVAASSADTDIPLVAESAIASAENASLYLGLKVGSDDAVAISTSAPATKTVSIAGVPGNFKSAYEGGKYVYRALTLDEYKKLDGKSSATQDEYDATWQNASFKLEGAVTSGKNIASTTTAPTVTVTWSWADPSAAPATVDVTIKNKGDYTGEDTTKTMTVGSAPVDPTAVEGYTFAGYFTDAACATAFEGNVAADTATLYAKWTRNAAAPSATATQAVLEADNEAEITVDLGAGDKAATGVAEFTNKLYGNDWISAGAASYENGVITITDAASVNVILGETNADARKFTIKFNDSDETTVDVTLTAKE